MPPLDSPESLSCCDCANAWANSRASWSLGGSRPRRGRGWALILVGRGDAIPRNSNGGVLVAEGITPPQRARLCAIEACAEGLGVGRGSIDEIVVPWSHSAILGRLWPALRRRPLQRRLRGMRPCFSGYVPTSRSGASTLLSSSTRPCARRRRCAPWAHADAEHALMQCVQAARVRGSSLASGAKVRCRRAAVAAAALTSHQAMLMRRNTEKGDPMVLLVLSASEMLDWKRVRRVVGRGYKLALPADVSAASGALPGAVPPFGSLFTPPVKTMVDVSLRDQGDTVHFNAVRRAAAAAAPSARADLPPPRYQGLRTKSIRMRYADWAAVEHPEEVNVAAQG